MNPRLLHEGPVGRWVEEEVLLPNGRRTTLQILHHPGAAAVVPLLSPDTILLIRQFRQAAGGTIWEVPAGKLDPDESPAVCAVRELEEETGYRAGKVSPLGTILTTPGFTDERIHLFVAEDLVPGRLDRGDSEVIEIHEIEFSRALDMIRSGEIVDAKTIVALYRVDDRRTEARDRRR